MAALVAAVAALVAAVAANRAATAWSIENIGYTIYVYSGVQPASTPLLYIDIYIYIHTY